MQQPHGGNVFGTFAAVTSLGNAAMSENKETSHVSPTQPRGQQVEREFREREIRVKEGELGLLRREQAQSGWGSPLVVAVLAAAVGAAGNAVVSYFSGVQQRDLESQRSEQVRVLEMIRTGDTEKAAANLHFLVETGLLTEPRLVASITVYLKKRQPGTGPVLPALGGNSATSNRISVAEQAGVQRAFMMLSKCLVKAEALLHEQTTTLDAPANGGSSGV